MRCKVGDLVVIAGGIFPLYIGHIVTVARQCPVYGPGYWDTDPPKRPFGGREVAFADHHLRPIRDSDGTDETLSWATKEIAA